MCSTQVLKSVCLCMCVGFYRFYLETLYGKIILWIYKLIENLQKEHKI